MAARALWNRKPVDRAWVDAAVAEAESLERRTFLSAYNATTLSFPFMGEYLGGAVRDSAGNLYGVTALGGDAGGYGGIVELAAGSRTITPVASFDYSIANGNNPIPELALDPAGDLFGVTPFSGEFGGGTIYEVAAGSNSVTVIAALNSQTGDQPAGGLISDANGNIFGVTSLGGASGHGNIYEVPAATHARVTLASFASTASAGGPLTIDSSGNLFGVESISNQPTIFELPAGSSTISTYAAVPAVSGIVFDSAGNFYGIAGGSSTQPGYIYKVAAGTKAVSNVATLTITSPPLSYDYLAIDSAGDLYGFTGDYSSNPGGTPGSIYEVVAGSHTITTLHSFTSADGRGPYGTPVLANGVLYGAFQLGGAGDAGTTGGFFQYSLNSATFSVLGRMKFSNGIVPERGLTRDAGGNFFGTTSSGGTFGLGTVYEVPADLSSIITVASFNGTNGANPYGRPVFDSAGNMYGTTFAGGSQNLGVVWKIPAGTTTIQTVASFAGGTAAGGTSYAGLAIDSSGNMFGTTAAGGASNEGTVFEIAAGTTTITTLDSFKTAYPLSGVTIGPDATLYGTDLGEVWKIPPGTSKITQVASMPYHPYGGVVLDAAGNIYGTTDGGLIGEAPGDGSVYKIPAGTSTVQYLWFFGGGSDGLNPRGDLTFDAAGDLFGTTYGGGVVFEIPAGSSKLKPLGTFGIGSGYSNVAMDPQGNLYGIATGGTNSIGIVWRLSPSNHLAFAQQPTSTTAGATIAPAVTVRILDSSGNVVTGDNATIALSIQSGPAGATVNGASVAAINGVATFNNLSLPIGGIYTLTATPDATDANVATDTSSSFTVALLGDTNQDGTVNVVDLATLAENFGKTSGATWSDGDFDHNGTVNVADLADLAGNYGSSLSSGASQVTAVPATAVRRAVFAQALPAAIGDTDSIPFTGATSVYQEFESAMNMDYL
jgi:uncharacterized repeat protein (TIGR03803 family)